MSRLHEALEALSRALASDNRDAVISSLRTATLAISHESSSGLQDALSLISDLTNHARQRGFVGPALVLIAAACDAAESRQFPRPVRDGLLFDRGWFEMDSGETAASARSFETLLARADIDPHLEALATLALGSAYALTGNPRTIATLREGLSRAQRVFPPDSAEAARGRVDLARALLEMEGQIAEAQNLVLEALPVLDRSGEPLLMAFARDVLGRALELQGKYSDARTFFEEALNIVSTELGPEHPSYSVALANLGTLCFAQGDYRRAEELLEKAYASQVALLGEMHPGTLALLHGLASIRWETGDREGAERLIEKMHSLLMARPQDSPPHVLGYVLSRRGSMARERGDLSAAAIHFSEASRLLARTPFEDAVVLSLADIRRRQGDLAGAQDEVHRVLTRHRHAGSDRSADSAAAYEELARIHLLQRQWDHALVHSNRAIAIFEAILGPSYADLAACYTTRACAQLGLNDFDGAAESLDRARQIEDRKLELLSVMPDARRSALIRTARFTMSLAMTAHFDRAIGNEACARVAHEMLIRRKGLSAEAARQRIEASRHHALNAEQQNVLAELTEVMQRLSALVNAEAPVPPSVIEALAQRKDQLEKELPEVALRELPFDAVTPSAIAAQLTTDEAYIDYVVYHPVDFAGNPSSDVSYGAFWVTHDGQWGSVRIAPGDDLHDVAFNFVRSIRTADRKGFDDAARAAYRMLLGAFPDPVRGAARLRISPDGVLHAVPFAALSNEGTLLVETTTASYVASARDLIAPPPALPAREKPLIIGDPDYYAGVNNLRDQQFDDVPQGALEIEALRKRLPDAVFVTRAEATKERVMNAHGPVLLHIVTHGDLTASNIDRDLAMAESFLAFAGYNDADNGHTQGSLSGLEASLLDLQGSELVTLSACKTALGQMEEGQGVFGLTRALQIAGARSHLVTLWSIFGETTAPFMATFYEAMLRQIPREDAVREAQLALIAAGKDLPVYWAPFVLYGARGPIPL